MPLWHQPSSERYKVGLIMPGNPITREIMNHMYIEHESICYSLLNHMQKVEIVPVIDCEHKTYTAKLVVWQYFPQTE